MIIHDYSQIHTHTQELLKYRKPNTWGKDKPSYINRVTEKCHAI